MLVFLFLFKEINDNFLVDKQASPEDSIERPADDLTTELATEEQT